MSEYQMLRTYLEVLFGDVIGRARRDERGATAEVIVLMGAGLLGAAAVAVILWGKLRSGAQDVNVPAPAAP
jgi:hypothetical protein